ncbi:MAG: cell division protein SepF [Erysipelotrichaceae bacterium]|nr:cell division protein SepF [Erysipelotrichaceae bacterium]
MGFMDKLKQFVAPIDEEETVEYEETQPAAAAAAAQPAQNTQPQQSAYERPKAKASAAALSPNTKMVLFEPRSFGEAEEVGARLKEGRAVVVNLHKLDREYAQRTIDFLTGVVYALDGNIQKIGQNVILCYPASIGVSGSITLGSDAVEEEEVVVNIATE